MLGKLINKGIEKGIYEHIITIRSYFFECNSQVIIIDKTENPKPTNKS